MGSSRQYPHNIEGSKYGRAYRMGYTAGINYHIARIYGQSGYYSVYVYGSDRKFYIGSCRTLQEVSVRLAEFRDEDIEICT